MGDSKPRRRTGNNLILFICSNWMKTVLLMIVGFLLIPLLIQTFGFRIVRSLHAGSTADQRDGGSVSFSRDIDSGEIGLGGAGFGCRRFGIQCFHQWCGAASCACHLSDGHRCGRRLFPAAILNFEPDQLFDLRLAIAAEAVIISLIVITSPWLSLFLVCQRPILYNADLTVRRWLDLISFGLAHAPRWLEHLRRLRPPFACASRSSTRWRESSSLVAS